MAAATQDAGQPQQSPGSEALLPSLLSQHRDSAFEKDRPAQVEDVPEEVDVDVETGASDQPADQPLASQTTRNILGGTAVPRQVSNVGTFFRQLLHRVWQFVTYSIFVIPPALMTGFWCAFMLYAIKLATALRNGTCGTNTYADFIDTEHALTWCTDVVGAKRWLLFLLSFSGMFITALYLFLGDAKGKAAGGMTTILQSINAMEEEIDRLGAEAAARDAAGQPVAPLEQNGDFTGMVSLRMCPFVWMGTVSTHLCGGSAGREGSALQMAAAIFSKYCDLVDMTLRRINPRFALTVQFKRASLVAAIAAGFSGIFGVPITGAIFAIEVLRVGELTIGEMLTPAVVGSVFADMACRYVNEYWFNFEGHSQYNCPSCQGLPPDGGAAPIGYPQTWYPFLNYTELLAVLLAAFFFGLCGYAFEWLLHHFKDIFSQMAGKLAGPNRPKMKALLTPFVGGWVIVLFWLGLCGAATTSSFNLSPTYAGNDPYGATFGQAYLGLSVYEPGVSVSSCFNMGETWISKGVDTGVPVQPILWYSWLIKLMLTTITLGAGFKGGEVTPLFFIGAALGNWIGVFLNQDVQLFAALGLVSVFAAAANTPIACTFMGIELFGGSKAIAFFVSCYFAYTVSNSEAINGIYKQYKPRGARGGVAPRVPHRPNVV